jgi:hypothetical protein
MQAHKDTDVLQSIITLEIPIMMWEFQVPNSIVDRNELHNDIEKIIRETGDKRGRTTNVKALMTDWLMTHHKPFKIICDRVEEVIKDWHKQHTDLDLETFMTTCWGSIYQKGDYSEIHAHIPALYSWVYYVKVDENSAPLVFPNKPGFTYKPKAGYGIIFPGWLVHEVPKHEDENERIIVVGNVEGTGAVSYPQRRFTDVKG